MNYTINAPEGTTDHGNPHLLCTPARWYDYVLFFLVNYVAHAATVVPIPGQDLEASICAILLALMLPGSAIARSVIVILRRAAMEWNNPLKCAARAGALCIVLEKPKTGYWAKYLRLGQGIDGDIERRGNEAHSGRKTLFPAATASDDAVNQVVGDKGGISEKGDEQGTVDQNAQSAVESADESPPVLAVALWSSVRRYRDKINLYQPSYPWHNPPLGYEPVPHGSQIHGEYWLHKDYYLALVPPTGLPDLKLDVGDEPSSSQGASDSEIPQFHRSGTLLSSGYNLPKLFVSLLQSIWAVITIYRARGDQIQQYGYAAFGLTVAPYATMSIINTVANMLTREYPSLFVLRTATLTELEHKNKACFNGALNVIEDSKPPDRPERTRPRRWLTQLSEWLDARFFPSPNYPINLERSITIASFILSMVPLAIVGGLSGFRNGNSTQMERGFTMSWLVLGMIYGVFLPTLSHEEDFWVQALPLSSLFKLPSKRDGKQQPGGRSSPSSRNKRPNGIGFGLMFALVFATPVFGGMVMVGKMIHGFGVCTLLRE